MASSIILSSLLCKDAYPENHGGNFHNYLNQELHFDEGCKIALSEVIYEPNSWDNVREGSNDVKISMSFKTSIIAPVTIYYHKYEGLGDQAQLTRDDNPPGGGFSIADIRTVFFDFEKKTVYMENVTRNWLHRTWWNWRKMDVETDATCKFENPAVFNGYIAQNQYTDKRSLMREIMRVAHEGIEELIVKNVHYDLVGREITYDHPDIKYQPKSHEGHWFWMDEVDGRVKLYVMTAWHGSCFFTIWFHPALQYMLGFTDFPTHDIGWISFEGAGPSGIGKYYESVMWSETVDGIDLSRNTFKSLWVYCDVIKPSFVGSNMQPLLRLLPVKSDSNIISYEVMANLHHHRIIKNNVQTIHVWFTESYDGPAMNMHADSYIRLLITRDPTNG